MPAPRRSLSTGGTLDRIKRSDEETVSVQLLRGQQGYGFSLRGGQDLGMPLFILRMADGGTAHRDGRLMVRFTELFVMLLLSVYPHQATVGIEPTTFGILGPMLCQLSYEVRSVRVSDISEQNLVPSIPM